MPKIKGAHEKAIQITVKWLMLPQNPKPFPSVAALTVSYKTLHPDLLYTYECVCEKLHQIGNQSQPPSSTTYISPPFAGATGMEIPKSTVMPKINHKF